MLNPYLLKNITLRVAAILSHISVEYNGAYPTAAYPRLDEVTGDLIAFPSEIISSLPFWFVVPSHVSNVKDTMIQTSDRGFMDLNIRLYTSPIEDGWPGEKVGLLFTELGRLQGLWSDRLDNNLRYVNGLDVEVYTAMLGVQQVSGISWLGIVGMSSTPGQWSTEEYVGLTGEISIAYNNGIAV